MNYEPWIALQKWLETAEHRVFIPFAEVMARLIEPSATRLRRDFQTVLALIKAHAILHQETRDRDSNGRIIATLDDYEAVRELVDDILAEAAGRAVSTTIADTVHAVERECEESRTHSVTVSAVARRLKLDVSAAHRRVQSAIAKGYLQNEENRPHRPARLVLGEPLPTAGGVLPSPTVLATV